MRNTLSCTVVKFDGFALVTLTEENKSLYYWVKSQRESKRRGLLFPDREALLNDIGFVWEVITGDDTNSNNLHHEEHWGAMYAELKQYREKYGHVHVPRTPDMKECS